MLRNLETTIRGTVEGMEKRKPGAPISIGGPPCGKGMNCASKISN